jgi:hypothetical protein
MAWDEMIEMKETLQNEQLARLQNYNKQLNV